MARNNSLWFALKNVDIKLYTLGADEVCAPDQLLLIITVWAGFVFPTSSDRNAALQMNIENSLIGGGCKTAILEISDDTPPSEPAH